MRLFLIAILTLSLGAGATLAQTGSGGSSPSRADVLPRLRLLPGPAFSRTGSVPAGATLPTAISPQREPSSRPQSRQKAYDSAVADCMRMWDSGTHMTKQEWSRSCKRVQTRLDNLNVDAIMRNTKTHVR
jgi:hypothetical protein